MSEVHNLAQIHGVTYVIGGAKDKLSAHNSDGDLVLIMGLINTLNLSHNMLYQKHMADNQLRQIMRGDQDAN